MTLSRKASQTIPARKLIGSGLFIFASPYGVEAHPVSGVIKHTVESMGTTRNGEYVSHSVLKRFLSDKHQRISNGFIETQSGSSEWVAALKLGGKVGESWDSVLDIGQA